MPRKKIQVRLLECGACHGLHAHWWYTSKVNPPSCYERQKRNAK